MEGGGGGGECNTGLGLGKGSHEDDGYRSPPAVQFHILFPPTKQYEEQEETGEERTRKRVVKNTEDQEELDQEHGSEVKEKVGKKLKLTKEQSTLLEDSFREHHTLNLNQKQELADRLKLRPRQIEVWFQNRRARNKLKQTQVDYDMLKKWCESLSSENRRLKKELQELRSSN